VDFEYSSDQKLLLDSVCRLMQRIGSGRMVEIMLTSRTLDAETSERLGLSHYLVEPHKALDKALELADGIAKNARNPELYDRASDPAHMSAADGLWTDSVAQAVSMTSDDARAGIDAFFKRRKIEF
jgi:(methylthio)acryloyl-CoA hydratase